MNESTLSRISRRFAAMIGVLALAGPATAQFYQIDDGTSDSGIGLSAGGEFAWANYFDVDATFGPVITSIHVVFGSSGIPGVSGLIGGEPFDVYLWGDSDMDPTNGATLLATAAASVSPGSIDTDIFQVVDIPDTNVSAYAHILVGASVFHVAGTFPGPRDESQSSMGRSWAFGDTGGNWDPDGFIGDIAPLELDSAGFPGVWLIRADAIEAPPETCETFDGLPHLLYDFFIGIPPTTAFFTGDAFAGRPVQPFLAYSPPHAWLTPPGFGMGVILFETPVEYVNFYARAHPWATFPTYVFAYRGNRLAAFDLLWPDQGWRILEFTDDITAIRTINSDWGLFSAIDDLCYLPVEVPTPSASAPSDR
jgi:hypothetical protein